MDSIYGFISHVWRVYYPEFEKPTETGELTDKPEARLPDEHEIVEYDAKHNLSEDDVKQVGVAIAEATYAVTGYTWYLLVIFLWIAYFVFALDNQTALNFAYNATSQLESDQGRAMETYSQSYTAQSLFVAISKLFIAKLADIFGRSVAMMVTIFCYTLGFLIMTVSQSGNNYTGGSVFYGIGNSGLQMVIWIILADILSARFRVLGYGFVTLPIFITFVVGAKILKALIASNWRWVPGMFCILAPAVLTPILCMLLYLEHKAKRSGIVPRHPYLRKGFHHALWEFFLDVDLVGLVLLVGGFAMIVVALIRASSPSIVESTWSSAWVIGCLTVGPIILVILLPLYEWFISPRPFLRLSWMNSDVLIAFVVGFFDNMAFMCGFQVAYNWVYISYGYKASDVDLANYFTNSDNLALTFFGVVAGVIILFTRRFKWFLVAGAAIRTIGFGLQIKYRTLDTSMTQAVWAQIVQGIGGAFLGEVTTLLSQITVRHQDVAMVTSVYLTLFSLGSTIGLAIYNALLDSHFPAALDKYATLLSPAHRAFVAASGPYSALTSGPNLDQHPEMKRQVGMAYNESAKHVLYFCIGISAALIVITLFVRDWVLPRSHNVVSNELPEKNPLHMASDTTYDQAIHDAEQSNMDSPTCSSPTEKTTEEHVHEHDMSQQRDIVNMGASTQDVVVTGN